MTSAVRRACTLLAVLVTACSVERSTHVSNHRTGDHSDCALACSNLRYLGCSQGNPIDMATPCKEDADCMDEYGHTDANQACAANGECMVRCSTFCHMSMNSGTWFDPKCVKEISSCEQLAQCAPAPACNESSCAVPQVRRDH